jgi:hypothetical protein
MKEEHRQLLLSEMGRRSGNAIALIKDLCTLGLLEEITGQKRNRAFSYAPY